MISRFEREVGSVSICFFLFWRTQRDTTHCWPAVKNFEFQSPPAQKARSLSCTKRTQHILDMSPFFRMHASMSWQNFKGAEEKEKEGSGS